MSLLGCYHRGEIRNPVIYKKQNVCDNTTGSQSIPEVIADNKGEWVIPNWQGLISNGYRLVSLIISAELLENLCVPLGAR